MAGKQKPVSGFVRDVRRGDRVRFYTPTGSNLTGVCLQEPFSGDPEGTYYPFSQTVDGTPYFSVCSTNRKHNLKPEGEQYQHATSYRVLKRGDPILRLAARVGKYYERAGTGQVLVIS